MNRYDTLDIQRRAELEVQFLDQSLRREQSERRRCGRRIELRSHYICVVSSRQRVEPIVVRTNINSVLINNRWGHNVVASVELPDFPA